MCGRFFRHGVTWAEYHAALSLIPPAGVAPPEPAYNIAPTQYAPIIRLTPEGEPQTAGTVQMAPAMWGLVPSWWHQPLKEKKFSTFNARAEGLQESNTFRGSFRHRRCLIPASGFYEWTGPKGSRTPFAIGLRNRRWFCFGGLWDRAMIDGSELDSFTIITTKPNDLMAGLHTRMPVILDPQDYTRWLTAPAKDVEDLFEPFPTDAMHAWPVGAAVGNVRNQGPQLIEEA
ncbi:SOS response-associated peptidase [uncultured Hyphomonas sp.]|uniref:SOS response-associated peptidase n=1 Tax=uncultured Hyphomonas sp. TaxID=225298 RepID=UPI002AAABF77|nr:SOS response-associated peptidase [uncultured Hyphomonas sp.]